MSDDLVVQLMPDAARAEEVRGRLRPILQQVCDVMADAKRHGLDASWQIGVDQYGRHIVGAINVVKPL